MEVGKIKLAGISVFSYLFLSAFTWTGSGDFTPIPDPGSLIEALNQNAAGIESIQSRFIQRKQLEFLDETITSNGRFWFKKENSLRWAYKEPFEYAIIINGTQFLIKDEDKVSSYDIDSNAAFREINDLIVGMVQGTVMKQEKFDLKAFENKEQYLVQMVPKERQMRSVISNMEIYFHKSDLSVAEIIMKESEKDYTVITFYDKQINETIPDSVFTTDF